MRTSTLLAVALATLGAQADSSSTTTGLFGPSWTISPFPDLGAKGSSIAASVVNVKASTATYEIGCVKGADKSDCNFVKSATAIQGPDTASFSLEYIASTSKDKNSYELTATELWDCTLHSSTGSASCSLSAGYTGKVDGADQGYSTSTTTTYASAPMSDHYWALTVTAGLESYTKPAATETGAAVAGPAGAMITAAPVVAAAVVALL